MVSSAAFPEVDRNPNTGACIGDDAVTRIATNRVHHSQDCPSHLNEADGAKVNKQEESSRVVLLRLGAGILDALVHENLERASALLGYRVPDEFLEDDWLWKVRLEDLRTAPHHTPWLVRAVVDRDTGQVVGHAGFHGAPQGGVATVAYSIVPQARGKGYARAALGALISVARSNGARTVRATIDPENAASLAVISRWPFEKRGEQIDDEDGLEHIYDLAVVPTETVPSPWS